MRRQPYLNPQFVAAIDAAFQEADMARHPFRAMLDDVADRIDGELETIKDSPELRTRVRPGHPDFYKEGEVGNVYIEDVRTAVAVLDVAINNLRRIAKEDEA